MTACGHRLNKQQKTMSWSRIKASWGAVNFFIKKICGFRPLRNKHIGSHSGRVTLDEASRMKTAGFSERGNWPVRVQRELGVVSRPSGSSLTGWGRGSVSDWERDFGPAVEPRPPSGRTLEHISMTECSTHKRTPGMVNWRVLQRECAESTHYTDCVNPPNQQTGRPKSGPEWGGLCSWINALHSVTLQHCSQQTNLTFTSTSYFSE